VFELVVRTFHPRQLPAVRFQRLMTRLLFMVVIAPTPMASSTPYSPRKRASAEGRGPPPPLHGARIMACPACCGSGFSHEWFWLQSSRFAGQPAPAKAASPIRAW